MKTTLRNRIFILVTVLFVVLLVSCSRTNTNTSLVTNNETPPSITPRQTPSPVSSSTQLPPPTIAIDSVYATNGAISAAYIAENIATMSANDPADATDFVARQTEQAAEYATSSAIAATLTTRNATCEHGYDYPFNYYPGELFTTNSGENWAVIECVPDETNSLNGYTEVVNYDGSKVFRIPLATGQF